MGPLGLEPNWGGEAKVVQKLSFVAVEARRIRSHTGERRKVGFSGPLHGFLGGRERKTRKAKGFKTISSHLGGKEKSRSCFEKGGRSCGYEREKRKKT